MASDKSTNIVMAICHSHTRPEIVAEAKRELAELQAKAAELDRRENGVRPSKIFIYCDDEIYGYCGNCGSGVSNRFVYCQECGTKPIWDSEV